MTSTDLGFLDVTGEQQAARLGVKGPGFAADRFVGFSVKPDGSLFPSRHRGRIESHGYVYALAKT